VYVRVRDVYTYNTRVRRVECSSAIGNSSASKTPSGVAE